MSQIDAEKYQQALQYRPENVKALFPNSNVLLVSGKVIHEAIRRKRMSGQKALAIAANGRNDWVIEGALKAAHKTNSVLLIEIAKSESGYCAVYFENLATKINEIAEKHNLKVVVAAHADHYAIKSQEDLEKAKKHIPEIVQKGITSVAIDASHLAPDLNVNANLELAKLLPEWLSLETEVGEIKGTEGLSTPAEALFPYSSIERTWSFSNMDCPEQWFRSRY
jgi:fructose-bisphosphate aldolase class II